MQNIIPIVRKIHKVAKYLNLSYLLKLLSAKDIYVLCKTLQKDLQNLNK